MSDVEAPNQQNCWSLSSDSLRIYRATLLPRGDSNEIAKITDDDWNFVDGPLPAKLKQKGKGKKPGVSQLAQLLLLSKNLWKVLVIVVIYVTFIVSMAFLAGRNWERPDGAKCRGFCTPLSVDASVAGYVGVAASVLVAFRVNHAFQQYKEGVLIWNDSISGIIDDFCKNAGVAFEPGVFHVRDLQRIFCLIIAFVVTLRTRLRDICPQEELRSLLPEREVREIDLEADKPAYCLFLLNSYVIEHMKNKKPPLPGPFYTMLMNKIADLNECQGSCERIQNYQFASGYSLLLRFGETTILLILPLGLVEHAGWMTLLYCPLIIFGLVGLEVVASELSDPFRFASGDIPLDTLTDEFKLKVRSLYHKAMSIHQTAEKRARHSAHYYAQ